MDGEIRFIGDMQRLQYQPGDVFVLRTDQSLMQHQLDQLRAHLRSVIGDEAPVLVLQGGMSLGLVTPAVPSNGDRSA